MENTIYIKDFTEYPGLRHCSISDDSGEEYYHSIAQSNLGHEVYVISSKYYQNSRFNPA